MELRQRDPRVRDEKHLNYIRSLPCCICGNINTEAAHIRTSNLNLGKRYTGKSEKPSDKWTVPLCNKHHREQHEGQELAFWKKYGIDPFMLALTLKAER